METKVLFFISTGSECSDASEYIDNLDYKVGRLPKNEEEKREFKLRLKRKSKLQKRQIITEEIAPKQHYSKVSIGSINKEFNSFITPDGLVKVLKRLYNAGLLIKTAQKPKTGKKTVRWYWGIKDTSDVFKRISKRMYDANIFLPFTYTPYFVKSFSDYFSDMIKGASEAQAQQFLLQVAKYSPEFIYFVIKEGLPFTEQILKKLQDAFVFEEIVAETLTKRLKNKEVKPERKHKGMLP